MSFINSNVQLSYFHVLRVRREKRTLYGAFTHSSTLFFDQCLNMIECHHNDIWSCGTGTLLVAPKTLSSLCLYSRAYSLAYELRIQAMHMHVFEYGIKSLSEERFGYFVRKSLEYRDRIRNNIAHLPQLTHEMFDYIDDMTVPLENVWIQSEITNKICKKRHGIKNEERLLSKNRTNLQILKEIEDCAKKPVTLALKEFLFDMYPNLFEIVDSNTHDFGYDEDDDDEVDNVEDESKVIVPSELIMSSEKNAI
jgi:hypothetical protein